MTASRFEDVDVGNVMGFLGYGYYGRWKANNSSRINPANVQGFPLALVAILGQ